MISSNEITGVILAGGKSKRMGEDKSLLSYNGESFIKSIVKILFSAFKDVIVISNDFDNHSFLKVPIYADIYKNSGPLAGIHSAMKNVTNPYIFITPCDLPLINIEIIDFILESSIIEKINISKSDSDKLPLLGIYPLSLLTSLEKFINLGKRRVFDFLEDNSDLINVIDLSRFSSYLKNINSIEDFESLRSKN